MKPSVSAWIHACEEDLSVVESLLQSRLSIWKMSGNFMLLQKMFMMW